MRLSEAMRLGAMWREQGFFTLLSQGKSCALGAVAEAIGLELEDKFYDPGNEHVAPELFKAYPELYTRIACPSEPDPDVFCWEQTLSDTIMHLNDAHRWTRQQIADWIEFLEKTQFNKPIEQAEEAQLSPVQEETPQCVSK